MEDDEYNVLKNKNDILKKLEKDTVVPNSSVLVWSFPSNKAEPKLIPGLNDIKQFFLGNNHAIALTKNNTIYTLKNYNSTTAIQMGELQVYPLDKDIKIKAVGVSHGYSLSYVLTEEGRVFYWGMDYNSGETATYLSFIKAPGLKEECIVAISLGYYHGLALTDKGDVFMWGAITPFTGVETRVSANEAKYLITLEDVQYIEAGFECNYAILKNGDVYSWGSAKMGNSGHNTKENIPKPTKITAFNGPIKKIAPGWYHSLALGVDGKLWVWGYGSPLELPGSRIQEKLVPILFQDLDFFGEVIDIKAGGVCSIALNRKGEILCWPQSQSWIRVIPVNDPETQNMTSKTNYQPKYRASSIIAGGFHGACIVGEPSDTLREKCLNFIRINIKLFPNLKSKLPVDLLELL